uniref:Centromere protein N n=1 Tax=Xiphophorus couchianus TaxID=32473 RepID=A0A3B5LU07_9TELE
MDNSAKHLLQRLVRRIPVSMLKSTLDKWERLTAEKRKSLDFTQSKWIITQELVALCEKSELTVKHITELEMIYLTAFCLFVCFLFPDDAHSVELMQFKELFKSHLRELQRNVSVKIKKHTDQAVWIRVAWGDGLSSPNHLKATYVVLYLQTPYVFVNALSSKHKPLLLQALTLSTRHQQIKAANLSGQKLTALRDLLMRQYQQVSQPPLMRHRMARETFGDGMLPALQSAVFKLETKFKGPTNEAMTQRDEPFICSVKFSSSNLLESLRHCASSGIASTPVTPMLSSIPLKGRNYFVITDNVLTA